MINAGIHEGHELLKIGKDCRGYLREKSLQLYTFRDEQHVIESRCGNDSHLSILSSIRINDLANVRCSPSRR